MAEYSASARALGITELLEKVLLHVDQRSLLTSCVRIKRKWPGLVDTLPALQIHLFFRPRYADLSQCIIRTRADEYCDEVKHIINPLLDWGFHDWFRRNPTVYQKAFGPAEDPPLFGGIEIPYDDISIESAFRPIEILPDDILNDWKMLPWNVRPDVWRRKNAIWRRMEITQPPV
jgi:hypothetical protein